MVSESVVAYECSLADSFVPNIELIRNMLRKAAQENIAQEARALFQPFVAFLSSEDGELVRWVHRSIYCRPISGFIRGLMVVNR